VPLNEEWNGMKPWFALAGFLAICLLAGALGGAVTAQSITGWYALINKPAWNPPSWVFAPVWTTLYIMMAVSAWLVWRKGWRHSGVKLALLLFFAQLALNALWPLVFFGAQEIGLAVVTIAALWTVLALTIWASAGVSMWAGILLLPYIAWVSFAGFLNYTIWQLN
jgi:translocator protein